MASATSRVWLSCSTGLGRALARSVLNHGERLVATARDVSALQDLATLVKEDEKTLLPLKLDVTKEDEVKEAFKKAVDHFGRIDVVVNNAGFSITGEFESVDDDLAQKQLDANFWGVVRVTREALRVFREVNQPVGGRLIQISSVGGFMAFPGFSYYHASKFAVEGLTEAIAQELKPEWNIKVTIVQPGGFNTDFIHRSMIMSELHPAYADFAPIKGLRNVVSARPEKVPHYNDPERGAEALYTLGGVENPPLRLPLGADAVGRIKTKIGQVEKELEQWMSLSTSPSNPTEQKQ